MKTGKSIHILLVALLCFGQWVSSIHAVGHLAGGVAEGRFHHAAPHATEFGENYAHPVLAHGTNAHDHNYLHSHAESLHGHADATHKHTSASHSHVLDTAGSEAEGDCQVYHIYLNQFTALCASSHVVTAVLRQSAVPLYAAAPALGLAVHNLPIRGPPTAS